MRAAYLDCLSGISGDMLLGALIDCGAPLVDLRHGLGLLDVPGWRLDVSEVTANGIAATDVTVALAEGPGHGRHLADIEHIIEAAGLPDRVTARANAVFDRLAEAEATVHRTTSDAIHFHEVGAVDAIVDIVGSCLALELLGVEVVYCSPLPMGHGFVECAHGVIPLPGPAVVELLRGAPAYGVDVEGELVTPTGAALAAALAAGFGPMPSMRLGAAGYGTGKKRFGNRPNVLRVVTGDLEQSASMSQVAVMETNLDDLSPQFYEVLSERLYGAGALDVFLAPVQMKKGRPGTLLTVLAAPERAEALAEIVFAETTTLGVRIREARRLCLEREWVTVGTDYGDVRVKVGRWKGATMTASPEYDDVKAAAQQHGVPVRRVYQAAIRAYEAQQP